MRAMRMHKPGGARVPCGARGFVALALVGASLRDVVRVRYVLPDAIDFPASAADSYERRRPRVHQRRR